MLRASLSVDQHRGHDPRGAAVSPELAPAFVERTTTAARPRPKVRLGEAKLTINRMTSRGRRVIHRLFVRVLGADNSAPRRRSPSDVVDAVRQQVHSGEPLDDLEQQFLSPMRAIGSPKALPP